MILVIGMACSWALAFYWWLLYGIQTARLHRAHQTIARLRGDTFKVELKSDRC